MLYYTDLSVLRQYMVYNYLRNLDHMNGSRENISHFRLGAGYLDCKEVQSYPFYLQK